MDSIREIYKVKMFEFNPIGMSYISIGGKDRYGIKMLGDKEIEGQFLQMR
jgi:hypothetical protein